MKSEQEIRGQIKLFEDEAETLAELLPAGKHKICEMRSIDREITALRWVLGELESSE